MELSGPWIKRRSYVCKEEIRSTTFMLWSCTTSHRIMLPSQRYMIHWWSCRLTRIWKKRTSRSRCDVVLMICFTILVPQTCSNGSTTREIFRNIREILREKYNKYKRNLKEARNFLYTSNLYNVFYILFHLRITLLLYLVAISLFWYQVAYL